MSATSIWAVQDALLAKLQASTTLIEEETQISLGWPTKGPASEHVWISGRVEPTEQRPQLTTGANPTRHEQYTLSVICFVKRRTDDFIEARDRAKTLADAVELAVQSDSEVGGAFYAHVVGHDVEEGIEDDARVVVVTIRVEITAYFSG